MGALGDLGFESFVETETGFQAYIQEIDYTDNLEESCWAWTLDGVEVTSTRKLIPRENWNQKWEESFQPILVDDQVYIYAPFHERRPDLPYAIQIEPKMSFGTGHHATTHLMVQQILKQDFTQKTVLDMGCGTGILAILSKMRESGKTVAIDVDDWSVENATENAQRNNVAVKIRLGGAEAIGTDTFDVILANINLNILLEDIPAYASALNGNGTIIFSGFYEEDLPILKAHAQEVGLQLQSHSVRNDWASAVFNKPNAIKTEDWRYKFCKTQRRFWRVT